MSEEIRTLHQPFRNWLRREKIPFIRARSDRKSTIALGAHDFTVLLPGNRFLAIEFKDGKNDLKKDQREWISHCAQAGVTVHVFRKIEDAVELVQEWRRSLPPPNPAPSPSEENKAPSAPVSGSPLRLMQWCGQTWTVASANKGGNGWSLLHKATAEELATLKPI